LHCLSQTATTQLYTRSLHDALPISAARRVLPSARSHRSEVQDDGPHPPHTPRSPRPTSTTRRARRDRGRHGGSAPVGQRLLQQLDRKSTRLNSSHVKISYAVFCLKK